MPQITTSPRTPDPARLINAAINAAVLIGVEISSKPDLGVVCTSTYRPHWEVDTHAVRATVSPLGAVLLTMQPGVPSVDEALTTVLGVQHVWIEGFEHGCDGAEPSPTLGVGPAAGMYAAGYAVGAQFRAFLGTAFCELHHVGHERGKPCPKCAAGVPVEAPIEHTEPTAQTLIHELLSSLTIAEALAAVAATIPGRGWDAQDKAEVSDDLLELVDSYKALRL